MLGIKGKFLVAALFAIAVLLTGRARLALDDMTSSFRDSFREMMYLPRGDALKVIACGFESPLADALFIKGMIYYAESVNAREMSDRRRYTFDLFDVITDLSPRFSRAYQMGALFLTASVSHDNNLAGIKLLQKGVDVYTELDKKGIPVDPDGRWLFHTLMANTYEINIQARRRQAGDIEGIYEARQKAAEEFQKAAVSPGAPPYIMQAAAGYKSSMSGAAKIESALQAVLSVWRELYQAGVDRGDKDTLPDLQNRIEELELRIGKIETTRHIEEGLSALGREYLARHGAAAVGAADLVRDGLLDEVPPAPLDTEDDADSWLSLPDGSFKSRILAAMETENHLDLFRQATYSFIRGAQGYPEDPQELVEQKLLDVIPEPPLKLLGQEYRYDRDTGTLDSLMPEGPELPPDRR